jgi:NodT family efflux transporter outer membrane factor (OMF) lipoprotein
MIFATLAIASCLTLQGSSIRADGEFVATESRDISQISHYWWRRFGDENLSAYVERGLTQNLDLEATKLRVVESRAVVRQNLAPFLPLLTLDSSITAAPLDSLGFQFGGRTPGTSGTSGDMGTQPDLPYLYAMTSTTLNLSLEIDVAGRNWLTKRASESDLDAARQQEAAQRNLLVRSIASAYFDLVTARAQLAVTESQIQSVAALLELSEMRFEAGQATLLDILTQRQQLASVKTRLPVARLQERAFEHQLAVLLGEEPGTHYPSATALPELGAKPKVEVEQLVERSDLRAAATKIDAAIMREKQTRRQWAPTLRLTGKYGLQSIHIGSSRSQFFWNIGAALSVPIYAGGRNLAQLRQRSAARSLAENSWKSALIVAKRELLDNQTQDELRHDALQAYRDQSSAARLAFDESKNRYLNGIAEYVTVLNAQNAAQQSEMNAITAHRDWVAARVATFASAGDALPADKKGK